MLRRVSRMIELHSISEVDLELLRWWRNCNRDAFLDAREVAPQEHRDWFDRYRRGGDGFMWMIAADTFNDVGCIALYHLDVENRSAELGRLIIAEPQRKRGYAREAIECVQAFARETLGLRSVRLNVKVENEAARALYRATGFVERGLSADVMCMEWDVK